MWFYFLMILYVYGMLEKKLNCFIKYGVKMNSVWFKKFNYVFMKVIVV